MKIVVICWLHNNTYMKSELERTRKNTFLSKKITMSNKIYDSSPSILKRLHALYLVFVYMYMVIDS